MGRIGGQRTKLSPQQQHGSRAPGLRNLPLWMHVRHWADDRGSALDRLEFTLFRFCNWLTNDSPSPWESFPCLAITCSAKTSSPDWAATGIRADEKRARNASIFAAGATPVASVISASTGLLGSDRLCVGPKPYVIAIKITLQLRRATQRLSK
jgi:hypothetical protein